MLFVNALYIHNQYLTYVINATTCTPIDSTHIAKQKSIADAEYYKSQMQAKANEVCQTETDIFKKSLYYPRKYQIIK